jgi:hypothetical protein
VSHDEPEFFPLICFSEKKESKLEDGMNNEDFRLISTLGQALYANPAQAQSRSIETVAAIMTLEEAPTKSEAFDRALELMLHQAERDGLRAQAEALSNPFFRLAPRERFVLFLLHSGRVSYRRLARLLEISEEDVQTIAWSSRTRMGTSPELRLQAPHPTGSSHVLASCPEFDTSRPWTQKLMDDEMGQSQLAFLQGHLSECRVCKRALDSTREFYYAVEKAIPLDSVKWDIEGMGAALKKTLRKNRIDSGDLPSDLTIFEAIRLFLSKPEVVFWTVIFAGALFALFVARGKLG